MISLIEVNTLPILRKLSVVQNKVGKDSILMRKLLTTQASHQGMLKTDPHTIEIPEPTDPFVKVTNPSILIGKQQTDPHTVEIPEPTDPFKRIAKFFFSSQGTLKTDPHTVEIP